MLKEKNSFKKEQCNFKNLLNRDKKKVKELETKPLKIMLIVMKKLINMMDKFKFKNNIKKKKNLNLTLHQNFQKWTNQIIKMIIKQQI